MTNPSSVPALVSKTTDKTGQLWDAIALVLALFPWLTVLLSVPRGFDLTDESFYLMSYAHPEDITAISTLFPLLIKPLYSLSGGNITALRALSVIVWCALAAAGSWITHHSLKRETASDAQPGPDKRTYFLLLLLPLAGGVLYYHLWLITPSYNWLTLIGLCVFWIGLLLWKDVDRPGEVTWLGAALFGFAAAFIFWSKATSAALLPLFPLSVLVLDRKHWRRLLSIPAVIAGGLGFVFGFSLPLWYGYSPQQLFTIISSGIEHQLLMEPAAFNGLSGIFVGAAAKLAEFFIYNAYLYSLQRLALWLMPPAVVLLIAHLPEQHRPPGRVIKRWSTMLLSVGFVANLLAMTYLLSQNTGHWCLNVVLMSLTFLYAGHAAYSAIISAHPSMNWRKIGIRALPIFSLAFVFTFGTLNNYALQIGMAGYFFLLGLSVLLLASGNNPINASLVQFAVPALLLAIIALTVLRSLTPYRQDEAVWQMQHHVSPGGSSAEVIVSEEMALYITELQALADASGFTPGTPLIDLTGETPGAAYILDGRAYGFPWLLGGYPGSDSAALDILYEWEPDQLDRAWVLSAAVSNKWSISVSILSEVGLDFPSEYVEAGRLHQPVSDRQQILWKPLSE
jgi:hypothetical protein